MALYYLAFIFICSTSIINGDDVLETYIVHMDSSAMPEDFSTHHDWFLATLSSVVSEDSANSGKLVYTYGKAIFGFTAVLNPSELQAVKDSPGYVYSTKDVAVKVDTTHSYQFLGLSSSLGAWKESRYGNDVIIGLVDTGIWPESESFSDDGMDEVPTRWKGECESGTHFTPSMCNKKLIGARYFNRGLLVKNPNLTLAVNSARDTDGHGTHTSFTAAGTSVHGASYFGYAPGTATGVAPRARIAMYKAVWDEGAQTSDVLAAIDQALMDGVDVLSLSLGLDDVPLYQDPIAIATFAAIDQDVFVSASAGNAGPPLSTLHNGTPWVLVVAAGTVDRQFVGTVSLDDGVSITGLSLYPGSSTSTSNRMSTLILKPCKMKKNKIHGELRMRNNSNKNVVVCLDHNRTVREQLKYITQNAGNVGAGVFVTNMSDLDLFLQETRFPSVFLTLEEGAKVVDYIKSKTSSPPPKAKLGFQVTRLGTKPAPSVASYSSRGPSRSCPSVMKPDLMAPGSLILASWPDNSPVLQLTSSGRYLFNKFNVMSGTSMACPHAAGVAALLKGVHPEWSPSAIRSAMMTTADTVDNTRGPIRDIGSSNGAATPLAMGAGHINPNKALDPGLIYNITSQDYINLLCAMNFTREEIMVIVKTQSYNCSTPSLDLNYPSFIAYFEFNGIKLHPRRRGRIQEFQRTLTNVGGDGKFIYRANLAPMAGINVSVVPNKLVFSNKHEKQRYKLRIEAPLRMSDDLVHGSLEEKDGGKHVVTSPIVATSLVVHQFH